MKAKLIKSALALVLLAGLASCSERDKCVQDGGVWFGSERDGYCCPPGEKCKDPQPTRRAD